jgi:hypothetical protein
MPREFKDREGNRWTIDLPVGTVSRVRQADPRFNLYSTHHELDEQNQPVAKNGMPFAAALLMRLDLFWELLWHIVEPDATDKGVDAKQFGKAMAADCLIAARVAFFDEWRDFFQSLQMPEQARSLEIQLNYHRRALAEVNEALKSPRLLEIEKKADEKIKRTVSEQFGNLQEYLDSILDDSPGVSST